MKVFCILSFIHHVSSARKDFRMAVIKCERMKGLKRLLCLCMSQGRMDLQFKPHGAPAYCGFKGVKEPLPFPRRRLASKSQQSWGVGAPAGPAGLATKCLPHCWQVRKFPSGLCWRAAGPDCIQPLQPASFTLLSAGGWREDLLFLRLLRELREGGGKLSPCME